MKYQYLITTSNGESPFMTNYYTHENHFNLEVGMVVYDLINQKFTNDGTIWQELEIDHL